VQFRGGSDSVSNLCNTGTSNVALSELNGTVPLAGKLVGQGQPCFIVYEAGPTHDSLESAKRLVKMAAEAKADAVKFQLVDPDRLVADRQQPFSYDILVDRESGRTETITEPLYDILCRRVLTLDEWSNLKAYSDSLGLAFFVTVNFSEDLEFVRTMSCDSLKIASADVTHLPLIREAARTGVCIQLDTGNSTLGEIETAVDVILNEGNGNVIIHQCPSGYPARLESINLKIIPTLRQMFRCPVAFSDHSPGWEMDVAAVAIGADLVEKTITEDCTTPSVEHIMSLEPPHSYDFVRIIRDVETALGHPRRVISQQEREKHRAIRRSVYLREAVAAGTKLENAVVDFRRPGYGVSPAAYEELASAVFKVGRPAGHLLSVQDLENAGTDDKMSGG
jgi:N,N'-diacetyllegionaminate synthase